MMGPQNVFDHCAQTLRRRNLKLGDFNINLWNIKKLFLFPQVIQCYHSNEFVTEYSRFSEVIVPGVAYNEILKVFENKI